MKILVLGSTGMLGSTVGSLFREWYGKDSVSFGIRKAKGGSVENTFIVNALTNSLFFPDHFDYVINCIGVINRRVAKLGVVKTIRVNSIFPHLLANYCKKEGTKVIHITTDCVFSGDKGEYIETDKHDASDVYGRSKSLGEPDNCMVLRTSIIGEEIYNKYNLVEWVKSKSNCEVDGYINHFWNGVTTKTYAEICKRIIEDNLYEEDTFHVFSPEDISKRILVGMISNRFNLSIKIKPTRADVSINRTLRTVKKLNKNLSIPSLSVQIQEM